MIKNVIFDLDGTLIKTNQDKFNENFFNLLKETFEKEGYDGSAMAMISLQSVGAMINNDGKKTNEEVFWSCFEEKTKLKKEKVYDLFNDLYYNKYDCMYDSVESIKEMREALESLKEKGYNLILATNPLFPKIAIEKRAKWGEIDCNVFSYVTSFENSSYSKPNVNYYKEIIKNNDLKIDETIMFGNDLVEDLAIEKTGINCYIIMDNAVNISNINSCSKKGNCKEAIEYINSFDKIK